LTPAPEAILSPAPALTIPPVAEISHCHSSSYFEGICKEKKRKKNELKPSEQGNVTPTTRVKKPGDAIERKEIELSQKANNQDKRSSASE